MALANKPYGEPRWESRCVLARKFTLSRTPFASLEEYVEQFATDPALTKVVLPASEAVPALPDLDSMGINNYHLFPDFTGLADRATMRLLLELAAQDW